MGARGRNRRHPRDAARNATSIVGAARHDGSVTATWASAPGKTFVFTGTSLLFLYGVCVYAGYIVWKIRGRVVYNAKGRNDIKTDLWTFFMGGI